MAKRGGDFAQDALDYRSEEIDFQTKTNATFRHNGVPILTAASNISLQGFGDAPNASGASLVGADLTLQPASYSQPGGVSVGPQTFGGAKTFVDDFQAASQVSMTGLAIAPTVSSQVMLIEPTGELSRLLPPPILPIGSTPNATGVSASFSQFQLQPASATFGGVVTAGPAAQSFGGPKVFPGGVSGSNLSGVNTGDVSFAPVGGAPSATGASVAGQTITLQPASATLPGLVTSTAQTIGGVKSFSDDIIPLSNIQLPLISTPTSGTILKNGARFLSTPGNSVFLGTNAGSFTAGVTDCTFVGHLAGSLVGAGCDNNTGVGLRSLGSIGPGASDNTCFGENSGANYTGSESRNCCIASPGVLGDNNQIRIGNTFHTNCTIRGISGVVVPGGAGVLCNASGLLGTVVSSKKRKREIEDIPSEDMARFWQLEAKRFKMNGDDTDEQHYGVIAEQADEIKLSSLVTKDEKGEIDNFQYFKLDGFYIKALQDIKAEIELQKAEIEALKAIPK